MVLTLYSETSCDKKRNYCRKVNNIVNYIFLMLDMPFRNWAQSGNRALDTKAYYMYP